MENTTSLQLDELFDESSGIRFEAAERFFFSRGEDGRIEVTGPESLSLLEPFYTPIQRRRQFQHESTEKFEYPLVPPRVRALRSISLPTSSPEHEEYETTPVLTYSGLPSPSSSSSSAPSPFATAIVDSDTLFLESQKSAAQKGSSCPQCPERKFSRRGLSMHVAWHIRQGDVVGLQNGSIASNDDSSSVRTAPSSSSTKPAYLNAEPERYDNSTLETSAYMHGGGDTEGGAESHSSEDHLTQRQVETFLQFNPSTHGDPIYRFFPSSLHSTTSSLLLQQPGSQHFSSNHHATDTNNALDTKSRYELEKDEEGPASKRRRVW